ncbi:MAG: FkbM family methyltransferase, partial [Roseomonas sp.]|nr:FkbM family methyltransferase [Roseomonas sp.]
LALLHGRYPMYLDTRGVDIAPFVMLLGIWEQNYTKLFTRLIRPGDTVLDLGAHLGVYTLLGAAVTGPTGQVHAFEPNTRFAQLLHKSLAVNGFSPFSRIHTVAVGAEAGATELRYSWEWAGGGHLAVGPRDATLVGEPCRIVALDEMFADPSFTIDVMKMDIEGTETFAIRGMIRLLSRSPRARIMFEFSPGMLAAHGSSARELIRLFQELGFRFWNIAHDSSLIEASAETLAAKTDGIVNILASRGDPFSA